MATLNISLPDSLKEFAQKKAATDQYSNSSDYVRSLIREDKERQSAQQKFEALLIEGLESGEPTLSTPQYWLVEKERLVKQFNQK